jgi:peptidoglycan/LPS O-acetylase OafA/YrhL
MPTAKLQQEKHRFRSDIQGLRAVAVIIVVLFHAGLPLPGGFVGVDVFFVISGYVITALLLRKLESANRIGFRLFYEKRIRRLIPALTLVLVTTLAVTFLLGSPFDDQQAVTAQTAIGAITLSANAVIFLNSGGYFATPPTNNPLLNAWSLSVEEQFYLVFPLLLLGLWILAKKLHRKLPPERTLLIGLGLVAGISFLLSVTMSFGLIHLRLSDPDWFAFYSSPTRAWEFAVGGIAYLAIKNGPGKLTSLILFWSGLAGIVVSIFFISEAMVFPG